MSVTEGHQKLTRQDRKAATRARIKQTALECFLKDGFEATGIGAIAKRAGVAHGTFYVHFPSKEAVIDELLEGFNQQLATALEPVMLAAATLPLQQLVQLAAEAFLDQWERNKDFVRCYAARSAAGLRLEALRDGVNPPMTVLLRAAWRHAAGDRVAAEQVELATQALLAMWLRVGMQYLFAEAVSRQGAVDTLVRMTVGAVGALLSPAD